MADKKEMSMFDRCKHIRNLLTNRAADALTYSWDDEYKLKKILEIPKVVAGWEEKHGSFKIHPKELTKEEMIELGFKLWDEEMGELRLIPGWLFPFLADEFECTSIGGTTKVRKRAEMDNDVRMGCLAYGVYPFPFSPSEPAVEPPTPEKREE